MENSLYYTFSTISQVLAAFISLSGVFVLFKLQELKKMQIVKAHDFIDFITRLFHTIPFNLNIVDVDSSVKSESIADIIQEINFVTKKFKEQNDVTYDYPISLEDNIIKIEKFKSQLKNRTIISILIGIFTIAYSLVILSCTSIISANYFLIFSVGIIGTLASIGFMTWVIVLSLRDFKLIPSYPILVDDDGKHHNLGH